LGGVFQKDKDWPFLNPIEIFSSGGSLVSGFEQKLNHYTCANFGVFDSLSGSMYTTLLGGISLYDYNPQTQTYSLDSLVPFVEDVNLVIRNIDGTYSEQALSTQLPGRIGANAKFIPNPNTSVYANGVIKFRNLVAGRNFIGYFFGGIRAVLPNITPSSANDILYRLYISPDFSIGIKTSSKESFDVHPNPTSDMVSINSSLTADSQLLDLNGKIVRIISKNQTSFSLVGLERGMYILHNAKGNAKIILN
jgi:hypothetical protein